MNDSPAVIDPKLTVAEILTRFPAARPILTAHGLDTCCGGSHPLDYACAAHGIPVAKVLLQLREAAALSAPTPGKRMVRETGRTQFSPAFLIASLSITLTLGAGSGLFYLWRMGMGAEVPLSHRQIHAHSQVLGFAALFIMGIALHALPRMLGSAPASAGLRKAILWLMVSGVVLRNLAQPFAFFVAGRAFSLLSGLLEAGAGTLFLSYVIGVLRERPAFPAPTSDRTDPAPGDPLRVFLPIVGVAFLVTLGLSVMQGAWLAGQRDATLPAVLTEPFYLVSLQGFVLAAVFAFAGRMLPVFLGIGPARRGTFLVVAALQSLGLVLSLSSYLPALDAASLMLRDAGMLFLALAAVVYVSGSGILWRRARTPLVQAPGSPAIAIRLAFSSLALWACLTLASLATAYLTALPARNPWWTDAARHLFTIGFLTLLIIGISFRVLPVFSGKTLHSPRLAHATYALVVLGVLMRLLQYPAAFHPVLYQVGSYMGIPVVLALILFTVNLMKTVRPHRLEPTPATTARFTSTLPAVSPGGSVR
jgi:hypothetical protein